jgi:hypothetical protein
MVTHYFRLDAVDAPAQGGMIRAPRSMIAKESSPAQIGSYLRTVQVGRGVGTVSA